MSLFSHFLLPAINSHMPFAVRSFSAFSPCNSEPKFLLQPCAFCYLCSQPFLHPLRSVTRKSSRKLPLKKNRKSWGWNLFLSQLRLSLFLIPSPCSLLANRVPSAPNVFQARRLAPLPLLLLFHHSLAFLQSRPWGKDLGANNWGVFCWLRGGSVLFFLDEVSNHSS